MIDVTANIRELLFRHDCVILPSFGGFIGNYQPAQIDKSTNTFTPPVKAISFNRNLIHNDGLLIGKISEEKNIGYADSKRIVEDFIEGLSLSLEKGERVAFDRIGYFQTNSEGSIEFEPDRDINFLLDSYGFSSFRREPVLSYEHSGRIKGRDLDSVRSFSSRKMAWRAIIAVPFIAAMIIVPLKTDLLKSKASLNPISAIELNDTEVVDKTIDKEVTMPAVLIESEVEEAQNIVKATYHVVAGSFKIQENALNMLREAADKGYAAELSQNDVGFYRVLLNSYNTKEEASAIRSEIKADYSDCWILKK
jgi:hypothetical protein